METCGLGCIKYLLFAFNFIFSLAGIGLIVAGGLALRYADYELLESDGKGPMIAIIVLGSFIFVTAFLGCCGAIKENYCMLMSFAVILIVIFIAQLSVGIVAAVYKDSITSELNGKLRKSIEVYKEEKSIREGWDEVQREFSCCGIEGPEDWNEIMAGYVPASCCPTDPDDERETAHQTCLASKAVHKEGCYEKLKMSVKNGLVVIVGVGIGIAFIELAGAILACFLAKTIHKESEVA